MKSSEYINKERRDYSLYVLQQRAIPHVADGLKSAARRLLWMGKDGKSYKSAVLAGATMPIHPHQSPEGTVNTLAAPYTNNIPLLNGDGTFGTLLNPTAYGASRYTSVKVSKFTQDVVFRDIEIIPMQDNYDGTTKEPAHFLPLVPIVLLNPQSGIAVGFATHILPHALPDIIKSQLSILENKSHFVEETPELEPINQKATGWIEHGNGYRAVFEGEFERVSATSIKITNLPYGILHEKYKEKCLDPLEEQGIILEYTDNSKNKYNIDIKFKRGILNKLDDQGILEMMSLIHNVSENLTVINFDGESVWNTTYEKMITEFCEWRLSWYSKRYQRLADLLNIDIQKYKDILLAIKVNLGDAARKIKSRAELKTHLKNIGVVHVDYISDLPVYRFTQEEKEKVQRKLSDAEALLKEYNALLKSKTKRKEVYVTELKEVLSKYRKGYYS
jgi:DNA gyrase subunit A